MRPRHPALIVGALIARTIAVKPVDHDAIQALLTAEEEPAQVTASPRVQGRHIEPGGVASDA